MRISLRHIEVFHAIMNTGSITKAAEVLRTSQPTLSRELAALERLLGFALFERKSRRLFATEQAVLLHAEVQRSHIGLRHLVETARAIRDNTSSQIRIACLPLFANTLVPAVCQRLLESDPASRISIHPCEHSILMPELLALRFELGLIEAGVSVDGVDIEEVQVGEEVCVLPAAHRLASKAVISPGDLDDENLVSYSSSDPYKKRFHGIVDELHLSKNIRVEATTAETLCALVRQGIGIALVNPISARAFAGHGVVVKPLSVSIPFVVGICRPFGRPMTPLANAVSKLVVEECHSLASELRPKSPSV